MNAILFHENEEIFKIMLINWTIYVIAKRKEKAQIMDHAIEKYLMVSVSLSTVEIFDC